MDLMADVVTIVDDDDRLLDDRRNKNCFEFFQSRLSEVLKCLHFTCCYSNYLCIRSLIHASEHLPLPQI